MDRIQSFLLITLVFLGLLLWQAWENDYSQTGQPKSSAKNQTETFPQSVKPGTEVPNVKPPAQLGEKPILPNNLPSKIGNDRSSEILVETDVLEIIINEKGATIERLSLKEYPITLNKPQPLELLGKRGSKEFFYQGGLFGKEGMPNHHTNFKVVQGPLKLEDNSEILEVAFIWRDDGDIKVTKKYRLLRGSYQIEVEYVIDNLGSEPFSAHHYEQLKRSKESSYNGLIYTFTGAIFSTPESRFKKFDFDDLEENPLDVTSAEAWIGNMQHYFVAALIPPPDKPYKYYSKILDQNTYTVGFVSSEHAISPGESLVLKTKIYAGPKKQSILKNLAPGLDLSVDYGMLWFLAKPLFIILQSIYSLLGNWGWAIVLLTVFIKLLFYPLSAAGYRSMAKLRTVHPKMLALKERHGDDKAQLNQAMMKLYKEEKINPLGGCFPILIQIPVFIALYWVLLETVEIRQAPFILWINDLSSKDPFFVLPLLMGVSMWVQQKLNPAPVDPIQAKVLQFLPVIFTVFFAFFPSGLVLYWVVNNVLSIAQQWRITSQMEKAK